MRAVRVEAPGKVGIVEAPRPEAGPGALVVRPLILSICGSDLKKIYSLPAGDYPLAPGVSGHEVIGVVEEAGEGSGPVRTGETVLAISRAEDCMAERFRVPASGAIPLPPGVPLERLLMAQQLGTVLYACSRLPNLMGWTAAVIGQGSAGLFFDSVLRRMGAARVIALDTVPARVAAGLRRGATHGVECGRQDPEAEVTRITGGALCDLVVEAAGEVGSIGLAPRLVRKRGVLLLFGLPREHSFSFDYNTFFRRYATTISNSETALEPGLHSFRAAVDLVARGEIGVADLPTHFFPFERVSDAYALARSREDGVLKTVVVMPGEERAAWTFGRVCDREKP